MRATANKRGRRNEICLSRKKIRKLQKPVRRNEKCKKRVYGIIMESRDAGATGAAAPAALIVWGHAGATGCPFS